MNEQIGGYIVAQGAIDYAKPLSLQADKDAKDRANWLKLEAARAEAQLKADIKQKGDPLKEILQFINVAGGAVSKFQAAQKQAEVAKKTRLEKERLKTGVELTKLGPRRLDLFQHDLKAATKDLVFDGAEFEKLIKARSLLAEDKPGYLSPEAVKKILALSGSSFLHTQNFFAHDIMSNPNKLVNELPGLTGPEKEKWQERYESHEQDPHAQTLMIKDLAYSEFARLGFSEEYIALNLEQPLSKFLNTKGVLATAKIKEYFHAENTLKLDQEINIAAASPDPNAMITVLSANLITEGSDKRASDKLVTQLSRLGRTKHLTLAEVELIRRSELPEELQFPAGKFGRDLFSDKQWNRIIDNIYAAEAEDLANFEMQLQKKATSLVANRETITGAELNSFKDLVVEHGLSHKEWFKQVSTMNLNVPESITQQLQLSLDQDIQTGFTGSTAEDIKVRYASDSGLQRIALKEFKEFNAILKKNQFIPKAHNKIVTTAAGLPWEPGGNNITTKTSGVAGHMEEVRRSLYMMHINENKKRNNGVYVHDGTIPTLVNQQVNDYWLLHGGGVQNKKDSGKPAHQGKFAFDVDSATFANWNTFQENKSKYISRSQKKWTVTDYDTAKRKFEETSQFARDADGTLNVNRLLEKQLLSRETLAELFETGDNPEQITYIMARTGLDFQTLLKSSLNHIKKSKDENDIAFVTKYQPGDGEKIETRDSLAIQKLRERIESRPENYEVGETDVRRESDMRRILRRIELLGWKSLSPNNRKLFYHYVLDLKSWTREVEDQGKWDEPGRFDFGGLGIPTKF